ncbi:unnamed protein product [Ranitomeya imitator]|uniref:Uncharacterized protein n=1 Tax=Ranitomeya imitator TaxID=111125 RepID=A0ABN9L1R4_9NEOB|nr:unnamed protein product [Ranitomeya imitator]
MLNTIQEFQVPFMSCFRRPTNLRDRLVRADVGSTKRLPLQTFLDTPKIGTFPCLHCSQCGNVQRGDKFFHPHTVSLRSRICWGETTQHVRDRISQHKSSTRCGKTYLPLPYHFAPKKHNISQLRFQVLEQIPCPRRGSNRVKTLRRREAFWINKLDTLEPRGLNRDYEISSFI